MSANSRDLDQAAAEPGATLLLNAREAARLAGISEPSWWRHHAAGLVPDAVKIGRSTRWRRVGWTRCCRRLMLRPTLFLWTLHRRAPWPMRR